VLNRDVLHRDVLLEDLEGVDPAFDHWLGVERARFVLVRRAIGERILARCDHPLAAIEAAEQLLQIDQTHERAWRTIIRCHAEQGDIAAAVAAYDRCRSALVETSDARPSPETEDLIGRIRCEGQVGPQPAPSPTPTSISPRPVGPRDRTPLRLRVMPFRPIGEERDDGLGVGLAEEISAGLSRFRWISCLQATLWFPGPAASHARGGSPTGTSGAAWSGIEADLHLEGTIQRAGGRVRIIVRLMDMRDGGEIVWASRFDREMTDALALQDELGAAIAAQVDPELMQHEGRRNAGVRSQDLTAQDLLLQALPSIYRMERDSFLDARRLLEMSLRAEPGSSVVHGWLAYWTVLYVGQGWANDPAAATAEAAGLAERAVTLDPWDARALTLAGHVRGVLGRRPEEARALHERAIALNPNLALAWCFSGLAHSYLGRHEEALRRINVAVRLSPSDPFGFFFDMAVIMPHLLSGDYPGAIEAGRRAVELNPRFSSAYKAYLSALGLMDRPREAAEVCRRLLLLEPGFSVREAVARSPLARPEDVARYAEGLRRAGLPHASRIPVTPASDLSARNSVIDLIPGAPHSLVLDAE
jgi:TolB-like protein/Flp pilus assembly protein TadD